MEPASRHCHGFGDAWQVASSPPPVAVLPHMSAFKFTGVPELHSAVQRQQQQLDGLVDKIAIMMSAMHQELRADLHDAEKEEGPSRGARDREAHAGFADKVGAAQFQSQLAQLEEKVHKVRSEVHMEVLDLKAQLEKAPAALASGALLEARLEALERDHRNRLDALSRLSHEDDGHDDVDGVDAISRRFYDLDRWRKHVEAKLSQPSPMLSLLRNRLEAVEERFSELRERVAGSAAPLSGASLHLLGAGGRCGTGGGVEQRLQDLAEDVGTLMEQRRAESSRLEIIRERLDDVESMAQTAQRQMLTCPRPVQQEAAALRQQLFCQGNCDAAESLRLDMEARLETARSATQALVSELRRELEYCSQRQRRAADECRQDLQREIDTQISQIRDTATSSSKDLRQELGNQVAHMRKLAEDQQVGLESRLAHLQDAPRISSVQLQDEIRVLRQDFASQLDTARSEMQSSCKQEWRRELATHMSQLHDSARSSSVDMRRDFGAQFAQLRELTESHKASLEAQMCQRHQSAEVQDLRQTIDAQLGRVRDSVRSSSSELRQEFGAEVARLQRLAEDERSELKGHIGKLQEGPQEFCTIEALDELKRGLELQAAKADATSQALGEDLGLLRQEVQQCTAQLHAVMKTHDSVQRMVTGIKREQEAQMQQQMQDTQNAVQKLLGDMRQEVEARSLQSEAATTSPERGASSDGSATNSASREVVARVDQKRPAAPRGWPAEAQALRQEFALLGAEVAQAKLTARQAAEGVRQELQVARQELEQRIDEVLHRLGGEVAELAKWRLQLDPTCRGLEAPELARQVLEEVREDLCKELEARGLSPSRLREYVEERLAEATQAATVQVKKDLEVAAAAALEAATAPAKEVATAAAATELRGTQGRQHDDAGDRAAERRPAGAAIQRVQATDVVQAPHLERILHQNSTLKAGLQGYVLEQKVTRCLRGLENLGC